MPSSPWVQKTKCVVNVQNRNDEACFRHSVMAALFPQADSRYAYRTSTYTEFYSHPDAPTFAGISEPTRLNEIDRFERNNPDHSVNVFMEKSAYWQQ